MTENKKNITTPENITRIIDLISAIVQRFQEKRLANTEDESLYISDGKGCVI